MKKMRFSPFRHHILIPILLPVLLMGVVICFITTSLITPPFIEFIQARIDSELMLTSRMGLQICESYLNYLLDLRLEDDTEMNDALKNEAIGEIENLRKHFQDIHLLITTADGTFVAGSDPLLRPDGSGIALSIKNSGIDRHVLWGHPVRSYHTYFPFWSWHVLSYVHDRDYQAPLVLAKRLVYLGTFGVLILVWLILLGIFDVVIRAPLKRLADATRNVAEGDLSPLPNRRQDEIGKVIESFNRMVDSLRRKNLEVSGLISALQDSEKRYRELFEGATEGIMVTAVKTTQVRYANPAFCRLLGYSETEMKTLTIPDLHPEEALSHILSRIARQVEAQADVAVSDIPFRHKHGGTVYMDIKSSIVTVDGEPCYLGFFTDVTARKNADAQRRALEARLHRSEKMEAIGLLAGGVAHDLNNILSGLVSYPELLLIDLPADSPLRDPIRTIEKSGKRAAAIVQDLLTLARRGVSVSQVVSLNQVVIDYLDSPEHLKLLKYHSHVSIAVDLDDRLMDIRGSMVHLSKTVMNLVSNAAEAVDPAGGHIAIATANRYVDEPVRGYDDVREGDYAVLTVADDGSGIEPQDLKRIFEPFYSKKVMGRSGTGLGMAVVWGTVKDHDGYIDVVSHPNRGTTFTLYFPVTTDARDAELASAPIDALMGDGETILVVDDIPEQREIAVRILTRLGYAATAVDSGEAAVAFLSTRTADLLILDMIMEPGMDGLETYRQIIERHPHQRAIIASGFSENDRVRDVQRLGARQYLRKPYTLESIGRAVKKELNGTPDRTHSG